MRHSDFFNTSTVEKKYATGYVVMGFFMIVLFLVSLFENFYVAQQYSKVTSEMIAVNDLEKSVNAMNENVNLAYLYLSADGIEAYGPAKETVMQDIDVVETQLRNSFVREISDTSRTIETYMEKSDSLIGILEDYMSEENRKGSDYSVMEASYNGLQEVYGYINLRFQGAYSAKLGTLSQMEERLETLQRYSAVLLAVLMAAMGIVCGIYLYRVIRSVSGSIKKMMQGVNSIRENVYQAEPIQISSNDEFDEFASAFNGMIRIIQDQMYKLEENADVKERLAALEIENLRMYSELQKSHLNFLQSRINPHFLFNTLNMISSLARIEKADKCADLMEITATFLRYNLDNISKTVTLKKEMENLKDYVAIQEYRYGGRYAFDFDIDKSCLDFKMPCMILQPLVENAIQHGIAMMISGGCVWIRVFPSGKGVCIEVADNGIGMTPEQIERVYEDLEKVNPSNTHIGLRNICNRLKLFYNGDVEFTLADKKPGLKIIILLQQEG